MGLSEWLLIIKGVLAFPKQVKELILLLQKTPSEKQGEVTKMILEEGKKIAETGRPTWEK